MNNVQRKYGQVVISLIIVHKSFGKQFNSYNG